MTVEEAVFIAAHYHKGQVDKADQPYIFHLMRVATTVAPEYAIPAILHDTLEDTDATAIGLRQSDKVSREDVLTISILTRRPDEGYGEYICRLLNSGDQAALEIKMADLHDHLYRNPFPLKSGAQADRYMEACRLIEAEYIRRRRAGEGTADSRAEWIRRQATP